METWRERQEALRKLRHAAMKMLRQRLAMGFGGWQAAYWSIRSSGAMQKAVGRLLHRELSKGWPAWPEVIH